MEHKFQAGDRVKRTGIHGPKGTVQKVRVETMRAGLTPENEDQLGVSVTVLWDNGSTSHFVPEGLEKTQG